MASRALIASCSAIASAISRCVSIVSNLRTLPVVSTKSGIELLMIGISLGITRFLLPIAIAVWNSISFWVWSLFCLRSSSTSSHNETILLISRLSAYVADMAAIEGSNTKRISSKSWTSFFLSDINVNPRGSSTTPGDEATYVPEPCRIVTMLREASNFIASRRELRPILSSLARLASLGSLSPGCKCSFNINAIMSSEIFWGRFLSSDSKFVIWFFILLCLSIWNIRLFV